MIYKKALSEHARLTNEADKIKKQLAHLPKGKLLCAGNGKYVKWYQSDGHKHVYIPKKNRPLAEALAYRKYLTYRLDAIQKELYALNLYLRHHKLDYDTSHLSLLTSHGYSELLKPHFHPLSTELKEWMNSSFESNSLYPEGLIHPAPNGRMVRSKSEALIAMCLTSHGIPFRYEALLILDETIYYPDFTLRHPQTGDFYYWEHFGMMDDPKYCQRTATKLTQYAQNGILPDFQLITTYETKLHPLSSDHINFIIEHYFC